MTGAVLVALILALQPVSASFNPVVTLVERVWGLVTTREALALVVAQVVGACARCCRGERDVRSRRRHARRRPRGAAAVTGLGEVVATFGLVLVIFGSLRSRRVDTVAFAVGGYITAAYWFTSSTSFANPAVTVARMFSDTFAGIAPSSVPGFVAMQLRRRCARTRRRRLPVPPPRPRRGRRDLGGRVVSDRPAVLFVCIHNAGRSQMAAGYLRHLAGDRVEVRSAGSAPGATINPVAVAVMREEGIDLAGALPQRLTTDAVNLSDVVVTMGCGDECPYVPGKRYEDWKVDDPAGQSVEVVRAIRDDIRARVETLIAGLLPEGAP